MPRSCPVPHDSGNSLALPARSLHSLADAENFESERRGGRSINPITHQTWNSQAVGPRRPSVKTVWGLRVKPLQILTFKPSCLRCRAILEARAQEAAALYARARAIVRAGLFRLERPEPWSSGRSVRN